MPRKLLGNYSKAVPLNIEFVTLVRQEGEKNEYGHQSGKDYLEAADLSNNQHVIVWRNQVISGVYLEINGY